MVAFLLVLIACILLFGSLGLVVFAVTLICILPFHIILTVLKMIVRHKKKHPEKCNVNTEAKRSKAKVLYRDGKRTGNQKSKKL